MCIIKILNTLGIYNFRVADEGVVIMTGGVAYVYNCYDKLFYNADAVTLTADQFELYSDKVVWTDVKIAFMRDDGKVIAFNAKDTERVIMFSPTLFTKIPVGGVGGRTRMDESDIYFAGGQFGTFCKEELGVVYSRTEKQVLITKQQHKRRQDTRGRLA